jgi:hypothetical protein
MDQRQEDLDELPVGLDEEINRAGTRHLVYGMMLPEPPHLAER